MQTTQLLQTLRYDGELRFGLVRRRLGGLRRPSFLPILLRRLPRAARRIPVRVPKLWYAPYPVTDPRIVQDTTPFLGDGFARRRVRFSHPYGVAAAPDGSFVVADTFKNRVILFAENGSARAYLRHADEGRVPLRMPMAVALDREGRILVLNSGEGKLHRYDPRGRYLDDPARIEGDLLVGARGLCVGIDGTILVAATRRHRLLAFPATGNGARDLEQTDLGRYPFAFPMGVAQARSGEIAVCDALHHRVAIFANDGTLLRTLGGPGLGPGQFNGPAACAYLATGELLVLEWAGNRLQVFAPDGRAIAAWGRQGSWLLGCKIGELSLPGGLAIDRARGRVLLADTHNHRIQRIEVHRISAGSIAHDERPETGALPSAGPRAGNGLVAQPPRGATTSPVSVEAEFVRALPFGLALKSPQGLLAAGRDRIWVADTFHNRVVRFSRLGGKPVVMGGLGKSPGRFINPTDIGMAGQEILVVDSLNSRLQRFDQEGKCLGRANAWKGLRYPRSISYRKGHGLAVVETIPGRLLLLDEDHKLRWSVRRAEGGIQQPAWVRWHGDRLYVADVGLHQILVFDARGALLGRWGGWSEHPAGLNYPYALEFISEQVCAVADTGNHRVQFYTVDGKWLRSWTGATEVSRLFYPRGLLWLEEEHRLIVADSERHRLVELDLTLAGGPVHAEARREAAGNGQPEEGGCTGERTGNGTGSARTSERRR